MQPEHERDTVSLRDRLTVKRHRQLRFRVWPRDLPELPAVRHVDIRLEGALLVCTPLATTEVVEHELYLGGLRELRDDKPAVLVDFLRRHGVLARPGLQELPADARSYLSDRLAAEYVEAARIQATVPSGSLVVPVEETKAYIAALRDMVNIYFVLSQDRLDVDSVYGRQRVGWRRVADLESAVVFITDHLTVGLGSFSPRVTATMGEESGPDGPWLYAAMCLQMAKHVQAGVTYKECQREGCRRLLFVEQKGWSSHHDRTQRQVKYCSTECLRRASQQAQTVKKGRARAFYRQGFDVSEIACKVEAPASSVQRWVKRTPRKIER